MVVSLLAWWILPSVVPIFDWPFGFHPLLLGTSHALPFLRILKISLVPLAMSPMPTLVVIDQMKVSLNTRILEILMRLSNGLMVLISTVDESNSLMIKVLERLDVTTDLDMMIVATEITTDVTDTMIVETTEMIDGGIATMIVVNVVVVLLLKNVVVPNLPIYVVIEPF